MNNQISPFFGLTDFFKPIYSSMDALYAHENENLAFLRSSINLFDFGQKGFTLLPKGVDNKLVLIEREGTEQSWLEIALRVAIIATVIIPLITLVGAVVYFLANDFQLQVPQNHEVSESVQFVFTNDDLLSLFLKYLGPACFLLASTNTHTYALLKKEPSLEKYRIGREALQQCLCMGPYEPRIIPTMERYTQVEKRVQSSLLKSLTAFDLKAAFKRANSNEDLVSKVYDLVVVSEAFAEFDKEKALEILVHAHNSVELQTKTLFGVPLWQGYIEHSNRLFPLARLARSFIKYDLEKANEICNEIKQESLDLDSCENSNILLPDLYSFGLLSLDMLGCREADTAEQEEMNIFLTFDHMRDLFRTVPEKAMKLADELFEFLNRFIEKFPGAQHKRIYLLLELSKTIVSFNKVRAGELSKLAMSEAKEANLKMNFDFYIRYVETLIKTNVMDVNAAADCAFKWMDSIKPKDPVDRDVIYVYVVNLLRLSKAIACFNEPFSKEMALEAAQKIKEPIPLRITLNDNFDEITQKRFLSSPLRLTSADGRLASEVLAPYDQRLSSQMLEDGFNFEFFSQIEINVEDLELKEIKVAAAVKAVAKVNPAEVKKIVHFQGLCFKRIAFAALVEGIID